jgi:hypothetical protein
MLSVPYLFIHICTLPATVKDVGIILPRDPFIWQRRGCIPYAWRICMDPNNNLLPFTVQAFTQLNHYQFSSFCLLSYWLHRRGANILSDLLLSIKLINLKEVSVVSNLVRCSFACVITADGH